MLDKSKILSYLKLPFLNKIAKYLKGFNLIDKHDIRIKDNDRILSSVLQYLRGSSKYKVVFAKQGNIYQRRRNNIKIQIIQSNITLVSFLKNFTNLCKIFLVFQVSTKDSSKVASFIGKHLGKSHFLNKTAGPKPATFCKNTFSTKHLRWLLLL